MEIITSARLVKTIIRIAWEILIKSLYGGSRFHIDFLCLIIPLKLYKTMTLLSRYTLSIGRHFQDRKACKLFLEPYESLKTF